MKRITVPDIGDFKNVPIIEMLVAVGDTVAKNQTIAVVESEKATLDIPSDDAGVVTAIDAGVGDRVSAGSALLTLQSSENVTAQPAQTSAAAAPAIESTSTKTATVAAIASKSRAETRQAADVVPLVAASSADAAHQRVYAGPAARRLARELGVDVLDVKGTGQRGRIVPADVRDYVKSVMPRLKQMIESPGVGATQGTPFGLPPWPKIDFAQFGPVDAQPLSRIRKIAGANLHRNWVTIPHVTNHDDADVTELEAFRATLNREREKNGVKVSPLAFVMKACVATLQAFPEFNASLDGESLILKRYFHVGFAADTANGLVVPVIRNADQKGVLQIAKELAELAGKARAGKLSAADMQGGCFSISSLGGIGGSYFTPIINAPEVAILGIGKLQTRVVWMDGQPQPRLFLPLSLSWDHRVVDGAAAGRFNAYLAGLLGDLRRLLL